MYVIHSGGMFRASAIALGRSSANLAPPSRRRFKLHGLHATSCQPLNAATMASPLRCARPGAALTAQLPSSMRVSNLPAICRRYLNQDVRITRTGKPILTVSGGRYVH